MEERALDWSTAEVSNGTLTVALTGDSTSSWTREFAWVADRLQRTGSASWGEVKLTKKKVTVAGVTPGAEADLRHFLESVVQQVNADHREEDDEGRDGGGDDGSAGPDQQMTDAFRGFAADGDGADEQD
jgi:hypothetical protein